MNRRIYVSDITMKLGDRDKQNTLSFRQKIELSKLLDKLGVSVIETGPILNGKQVAFGFHYYQSCYLVPFKYTLLEERL